MNRLLIAEHPLQVLPSLATAVGLEKAIILQQIHYWTVEGRGTDRDGHQWVYNTYAEWHEQFPFISERSIRRHITELERGEGMPAADEPLLVTTTAYNRMRVDRTKWYRLDYAALDRLAEAIAPSAPNGGPTGQSGQSNRTDGPPPGPANPATPITRDYPETNNRETPRADAREGSANQHPADPETGETPAERRRAEEPALLERFDRWYQTYPRKVGKGAARRAWLKLRPDEALTERMIAAVARQKTSPQWVKDGGQYIPHPATWLNQERWEDEAAAPPARPGVQPPAWYDPNRRIDPSTLTPEQREELRTYTRRLRGHYFHF